MTTHLHRGSNENLIVEIIKVIPGTSKEKKKHRKRVERDWGGGVQDSQ